MAWNCLSATQANRSQMHVLCESTEERWRSGRAQSKQQCLLGTGGGCGGHDGIKGASVKNGASSSDMYLL
jgi:hypothetical protein